MTGLELLKEEMRKRGANKAMIESKTLPMVLDIVAETGNVYTDYKEQDDRLEEKRLNLNRQSYMLDNRRRRIELDEKDLEESVKAFNEEAKAYIENFLQELKQCETAEGRDRMRIAQTFVNSVDVNTKYDNTAFIIGLASIMANGSFGAIDELKKINPQLYRTKNRDINGFEII